MSASKEIILVGIAMLLSGLAGFGMYKYIIAPQSEINYIDTGNNIGAQSNLERTTVSAEDLTLADLVVKDVNANPVALDKWSDRVLVVNFWATWCPPCRKEIPVLIETQNQFDPERVQFLGIAMDDADAVKKYMQQTDFNYPILISDMNQTIRISEAFNHNYLALPFTLFMSADGSIKKGHTGELDAEELQALITSVFSTE